MSYYADFRAYLKTLEENEKLVRVKREINKDTELQPLVRWQFRGLPEEERKAFLFENIIDSRGRKHSIPVAIAAFAASREIYALGMKCRPGEIFEKWAAALQKRIDPVIVDSGPVQQEVYMGDELLGEGRGLDKFPIPISTPGFDPTPYVTAGPCITKDPETGVRNVGNYRIQVKAHNRTGILINPEQHIGIHYKKCKAMGRPLEAALVLGATPNLVYTAVSKIPYGIDEIAVAGAIAGEPMELVKCKTVDLEVPARAEIVIEGRIPTDYLEPEAPFGEYTGFSGYRVMSPCFEVSCITHRKDPIWPAIISQMPPSESTKMKQIGAEGVTYNFLKYNCNIPSVAEVAWHEMGGSWEFCVISMKKQNESQPWQALNAAVALDPTLGKIFIVVDEDIDPRDPESVIWALSFRMQPHLDTRITIGKSSHHDPSSYPPGKTTSIEERNFPQPTGTSALLINATRKWPYPPVSLPKKEYMEKARAIWEELGLPELKPKHPWHGYSLGLWTPEDEYEADQAVKGQYYKVGEDRAKKRVKS